MNPQISGPIETHWIVQGSPAASGRELADAVATADPTSLEPWHHELAKAVHELHESAGSSLAWDVGDPVVVLVRALAQLTRRSPDAASPAAASLLAILEPARR